MFHLPLRRACYAYFTEISPESRRGCRVHLMLGRGDWREEKVAQAVLATWTGQYYSLVRKEGFEPPRPFGHRILSPARLPIPPLPHRRCSDYNKSEIVTPTLTIDLLLGCWQSHPMKLKRMEDAARINVFFLAACLVFC